MLSLVVVFLLCYLIGSIPSSLWTGRAKGVDIRKHGSGNAGATNTFRVLGWKAGIFVLLADFSKGFFCTAVISQLAYHIGSGPVSPSSVWEIDSFLRISCGAMAVFGHMYSIYASFEGGKGAATAAGMLYGIEPLSISITLVFFVSVIAKTKYVSMGTMVAALIYPISQLILRNYFGWPIDPSVIFFSSGLALVIIIKHHSNIKRLLNGTENKVTFFAQDEHVK
ncbi:MAG: glycerol-3-phosphate 1-O-acyltransferase PlsY [Balneolaceae bacterium]